jgi:tripeptide aminopeptidase
VKNEIIKRFTSYVQVDTQSNDDSETCPSTPGQLTLGKMLVDELKSIGMEDITMDENGYVMATLPSNTEKQVPTIGFLAHLDTATEISGADVKPQIVENYDGRDIVLNKELQIVLSPRQFPDLEKYIGQTLITTDGTTLLGADDKAGIAEIMTAMAYLIQHPQIKHGRVRICFNPDEEIGRGAHRFDVAAFGANVAYTMDGGQLGELEYESFNGAEAKITIHGKVVHPGYAKNKMINSVKIAMELNGRLPAGEAPEHTEGYQGFYHLMSLQGDVDQTKLNYIIRDFDRDQFNARKARLAEIVQELQAIHGEDRIVLKMKDQYYNMKEKIEPVKEVVDIAHLAMENLGIKPIVKSIRGGTDGNQLSYMGLPTPNIFAGGENWHGRFEYVSVDTMIRAVHVIVEILKLYEEQA